MPVYGFICDKCNHSFDVYLTMDERDGPLKKKCPGCSKKKGIRRQYDSFSQSIGTDSTLTPNKRYHKNLDQASSNTGRYWRG
jgi:putative FmdB family regulatory protein